MIFNKTNFDHQEFKTTDVFSPFGPLMMKGQLKEDTKNKLDKSVKALLDNNDNSDKVVHGDYGAMQDSALKSGKFKIIGIENIEIIDVVHKLCNEWFSCSCLNLSETLGNQIIENFKNSNVVLTSMWAVSMKSGDFHVSHNHVFEGAMLSGGIYLDVPEYLKSPEGDINWSMPVPGVEFRSDVYKHSPKSGDWFIWPSWLQHHVYPFRGNGERIMMSFNARLEAKQNV